MTYIIIENGYNNILPNQYNKLTKIPQILSNYNKNQIKNISNIIYIYTSITVILCLIYLFFFYVTNKSIIDGMDKVTKIKREKIEEIIKRIKIFNLNIKRFREKDIKEEDNKNTNIQIFDDENKFKSKNKKDININTNRKRKSQISSILNANGFNTDYKKYIPLNLMKYSFLYIFAIILYEIACKITIYIYSRNMILNSNQLLILEKYILGNLIVTSTSWIEIKCFINECNIKELNVTKLNDYNIIQDLLKSLKYFPIVNEFYNDKYLLNACSASFDQENQKEDYNKCLNDLTIKTANNTENLLRLIDDLILNIKKEYEIQVNNNHLYNKKNLFNEINYREIENIFFNYLINVEGNFVSIVMINLSSFLYNKVRKNIIILILYALISIFFCVITRLIIITKIIHYLSVSRCIMKIIPTYAIISTPELEFWLESKY